MFVSWIYIRWSIGQFLYTTVNAQVILWKFKSVYSSLQTNRTLEEGETNTVSKLNRTLFEKIAHRTDLRIRYC